MTPFWIVNATLWSALFIYLMPSAWASATGRGTRFNDPARLAVAGVALMMAGFSYRWLLMPTSELTWKALYLLSAVLSVYTGYLLHAYGRGPEL